MAAFAVNITIDFPQLTQLLTQFLHREDTLMATIADVQAKVTTIGAAVHNINVKLDGVAAEIANLKDQLAAGSPVTQEQLDALDASLQDVMTESSDVVSEVDTL
jgi:septal ring factor EnvC (AmiA/AmiB activator)